ncbi:MAG: Gfo/Idh/MocA family oxidoreductase [Oscillospiraceae bacterium]
MDNKKVTLIIAGLGGRGNDIYADYALKHPDEVKVVAIADPRPDRLANAQKALGLPNECCFATAEELFAQPKMADAAAICTQDRQHVAHAELALGKKYHLLLEKPVAVDIKGCLEVLHAAKENERHVTVCHVLRYTPFYNTLKKIIDDGKIGDVVNIQAAENIGYWHYAHSYVRGNWRKSEDSSPMILAKCCHDMDILLWLSGKRAKRVSSFGSNYLFNQDKAPKGCAERCLDCAVRESCPYDAVKYYLDDSHTSVSAGKLGWPINVLNPKPTYENIKEALRSGQYGRCVYHCDNDVVDHQVVNISLEDGVTIDFTVSAFSERCYRTLKVMGTKGCIEGDMDTNCITWHDFMGNSEIFDINVVDVSLAGHGGGDALMMKEFVQLLSEGSKSDNEMQSNIEHSIESHVVALLAEQSRLNNGESLEVSIN